MYHEVLQGKIERLRATFTFRNGRCGCEPQSAGKRQMSCLGLWYEVCFKSLGNC